LVEAVKTIFGFLKYLSPIEWLQWWRPTLWPAATELYVVACLLIEFVVAINITKIAGWPSWLPYVVLVLASLRILTIVRVTMSVVLFDEGEVASVQRTFILAAINFLELCLCYGLFYALNKKLLLGDQIGALTGFYFSFITQLTIGFGDVHPVGWLRVVAVIQGLTAALFILLVFGTIVASLRPLKSEKDKPI
jgi:Ion channel